MKFTKIDLSKFPFVRPYGDYQDFSDFEKWHRFIKNNEFYSYCNGLPVYSTLRRYFETGGDHGMALTCERPPEYDHGYMYKRKGGKPILQHRADRHELIFHYIQPLQLYKQTNTGEYHNENIQRNRNRTI